MEYINIFDIPGQPVCSARSDINTILINGNGTPVTIPLNVWASNTDKTFFQFEENGIKILRPGYYLISAGLFFSYKESSEYNPNYDYGVYVFDSNGTELISVRHYNYEGLGGDFYTSQNQNMGVGGIGTGAKIVKIEKDTILYLKARCVNADGIVVGTDAATLLTIVRL
jgi:hypothetical protein